MLFPCLLCNHEYSHANSQCHKSYRFYSVFRFGADRIRRGISDLSGHCPFGFHKGIILDLYLLPSTTVVGKEQHPIDTEVKDESGHQKIKVNWRSKIIKFHGSKKHRKQKQVEDCPLSEHLKHELPFARRFGVVGLCSKRKVSAANHRK